MYINVKLYHAYIKTWTQHIFTKSSFIVHTDLQIGSYHTELFISMSTNGNLYRHLNGG
jgi:hypothetical protein